MGRKSNCCGLSWFVNDGVGIGCAVFTYLLIAYAEFVVVFVMLLPEVVTATGFAWFHAVAFTLLACLALVAHSRAMCSDPVSVRSCHFMPHLDSDRLAFRDVDDRFIYGSPFNLIIYMSAYLYGHVTSLSNRRRFYSFKYICCSK